MSSAATQTLPTLQSVKTGAKFSFALEWSCHVQDGETLSSADTTVEQAPEDDATVLADSHTSINGTSTTIAIEVPDAAPVGRYHLRHVVTTSAGQQYVECFSFLVEPC